MEAGVVVFMVNGVIVEQGEPPEIFTNSRHERAKSFLAKVI
ncbi:hypothetical protein [Arthrobacter sp. H14-L1]|nr:hypothetical protein [Arthrobacter sp. H14-L1]MCY0906064.1 hypothetical protein [Arthrobacter sp. H14-L1]